MFKLSGSVDPALDNATPPFLNKADRPILRLQLFEPAERDPATSKPRHYRFVKREQTAAFRLIVALLQSKLCVFASPTANPAERGIADYRCALLFFRRRKASTKKSAKMDLKQHSNTCCIKPQYSEPNPCFATLSDRWHASRTQGSCLAGVPAQATTHS